MRSDDSDWWPENETRAAIIVRYGIALAGPVAALRLETTFPADAAKGEVPNEAETMGLQFLLDADGCRMLGEHFLQVADMMTRNQRPMN